jgi:hypothetical protein
LGRKLVVADNLQIDVTQGEKKNSGQDKQQGRCRAAIEKAAFLFLILEWPASDPGLEFRTRIHELEFMMRRAAATRL